MLVFNLRGLGMKSFLKAAIILNVWIAVAPAVTYRYTDLEADIRRNRKMIFYFVSGGMPLSIPGLKNIQSVAREMGYSLRVLQDPLFPFSSHNPIPKVELSPKFLNAGVFLHFPSVILYEEGKLCGPLVPGFKKREEYRALITLLHQTCGKKSPFPPADFEHSLARTGVVSETKLPRKIKYYTRPVDLEWVAYHDESHNFLFNRTQRREITIPGVLDALPTPDGKFITVPAPLRFFSASELIAGPDDGLATPAILTDESMMDQYESSGQFNRDGENYYRVITTRAQGVQFRDYQSINGTLVPEGTAGPLCSSRRLSTPMIGKNGQRIGAFDFETKTTVIFDVGMLGDKCDVVRDLGIRTGKVSLDSSGNNVIYSAVINDVTGIYVENLSSGERLKLAEAPQAGNVVFPDFLENGNFIFLQVTAQDHALIEMSLAKN